MNKQEFKDFCKQRIANSAFQDPCTLEQQYYNIFIEKLIKQIDSGKKVDVDELQR